MLGERYQCLKCRAISFTQGSDIISDIRDYRCHEVGCDGAIISVAESLSEVVDLFLKCGYSVIRACKTTQAVIWSVSSSPQRPKAQAYSHRVCHYRPQDDIRHVHPQPGRG